MTYFKEGDTFSTNEPEAWEAGSYPLDCKLQQREVHFENLFYEERFN